MRNKKSTSGHTGERRRPETPIDFLASPSVRPIRKPKAARIVGARTLADGERAVPSIVLTGEWLARIGFPIGTRYLVSIDVDARVLLLHAA